MQTPNRLVCTKVDELRLAVRWLKTCELIAVDVETIPHRKKKPKPIAMTVSSYSGVQADGELRSFAIPLTSSKSSEAPVPETFTERLFAIRQINQSPVRKTLHNGVYDAAWFIRYGVGLRQYAYDSMTMWWSKYPDMPKTLDFVSSILLDDHSYWKMGRAAENFFDHIVYSMQDTETTLRNTLVMIPWFIHDSRLRRNFTDAHTRCLIGLHMTMKGMAVDFDMREQLKGKLHEEADKELSHFQWLVADPEANPNSPKQMQKLFYKILGAAPRNSKGREIKRVTSKNSPSTGATVLRLLKAEHPIFERVISSLLRAKEPAKQLSNVMGIEFPDGRFRTSYDGVGTTTSRFASRSDAFGFGGNAQNIRKSYRKILRADKDSFLLEIDFSGADDVFVSYESEEPRKIELVESGKDIHSFNASHVFFTNWTYEEVVIGKKSGDPRIVHPITGIRQITKKTTHGSNYLMAGMTLLMTAGRNAIVAAAKHLGHDEAATWTLIQLANFCGRLDQSYRAFYPRFKRDGPDSFYTDLNKELRKTGGFTTIFNYYQSFNGDHNDQSTLRAVAGSVGQANTAGRVNMAMQELLFGIRIRRFRDGPAPDAHEPALPVSEEDFGTSMRLQTHDSLTYNVNYKHPHWQEGVNRILHVMRRPVFCKGRVVNVGIEADVQFGWARHTHEIRSVEEIEMWLEEARAIAHIEAKLKNQEATLFYT